VTITLPLEPQEEARLLAVANAKGVSTGVLIREALDKIFAAMPEQDELAALDSRPIWEVIADNMSDVPPDEFEKLPVDGASEHDHYLYGHPKRSS
jgi:hypothetical protein